MNRKETLARKEKIVVIGGGTGTFVVLTGLKKYFSGLTAIVSMADSGGCNRVIRDEFGLLPTSDIRQCFVALASGDSETERIMRQLFIYRFGKGTTFAGMTFGNLFMAALADILGSQYEAIKKTGRVLRISGQVIPVTFDDVDLVAKYEDGEIIKGEHNIDEPPAKHDGKKRVVDLWCQPEAKASPEALKAIKEADLIILGPGDLYTSVLANLVVKGIAPAIKRSRTKLVFIVNLMTKLGQTFAFKASDHINQVKKYVNRAPDVVILNKATIPGKIRRRYWEEEGAVLVEDDLPPKISYQVIRGDFLSKKIYQKAPSDVLKRSLVRHDSVKLAKAVVNLLK